MLQQQVQCYAIFSSCELEKSNARQLLRNWQAAKIADIFIIANRFTLFVYNMGFHSSSSSLAVRASDVVQLKLESIYLEISQSMLAVKFYLSFSSMKRADVCSMVAGAKETQQLRNCYSTVIILTTYISCKKKGNDNGWFSMLSWHDFKCGMEFHECPLTNSRCGCEISFFLICTFFGLKLPVWARWWEGLLQASEKSVRTKGEMEITNQSGQTTFTLNGTETENWLMCADVIANCWDIRHAKITRKGEEFVSFQVDCCRFFFYLLHSTVSYSGADEVNGMELTSI